MRRVLLIYGNTFVAASENVAANLATGWLERVMEIYRDFGLAEQAEALAVRIRDLGPRRVEEMKPVSSAVEVPAAEVEEYVAAMTAGSLEEVLSRIASKFLPRKDELAKQVERMANLTPFSAMVRREIVDYDGRPVAAIGSVEDDLEGHIVLQAAQTMWMNVPWLREVMERTRFRLHPSAADLRDHLLRSPIFEAGRAAILERGIEAYLDSDPIAAAPILIPQIEHTVRNLLRLSGGSTYKPKRHRNGGLMLKNLDDLMREEAVIRALGEDVAHYFQVLFTDQRGWNIRHDTSHGSLPTEAFTMPMIDRVFHALLILATVRAKEPTPAGGPAPDPAPKKPAAPQKVH